MKIKKGDNIVIITGKDRGKKGKIARVLIRQNKVIVEGANLMKKHQRPKKSNEKGSVVSVAMPIHASNVKKVD